MNSEDTVKLGIAAICAVAFISGLGFAAHVGASRAEATKACYEAAKVNHNITCQQEPKA